jgi:hypothetical protein
MLDILWIYTLILILFLIYFYDYLNIQKAIEGLQTITIDETPKTNCPYINENGNYVYNDFRTSMSNLNKQTQREFSKYKRVGDYPLKAFYIMSAYNCCATGDLKGGKVDICALDHCLRMGAKFLDFEIYSKNGMPIVATSTLVFKDKTTGLSVPDMYTKESENMLPLSEVINYLSKNAFTTCPNKNDPLILNFRIMSDSHKTTKLLDNMADIMINNKSFYSKLLTTKYPQISGNGCPRPGISQGHIPNAPIKNFNKDILISCSFSNYLSGSKLFPLVVLDENCNNFMIKDTSTTLAGFKQQITGETKKAIVVSLPDRATDKNINGISLLEQRKLGIQCIAMRFQNYDNSVENEAMLEYLNFFNYSAYVLKPFSLIDAPMVLKKPSKQTEKVSYAKKKFNPLDNVKGIDIDMSI